MRSKNDLIMWNINGPKTKPILNEQTEGCDQARLKRGRGKKVNLCPQKKKHKLSEDKQITE